jgi:hypothetical protein
MSGKRQIGVANAALTGIKVSHEPHAVLSEETGAFFSSLVKDKGRTKNKSTS